MANTAYTKEYRTLKIVRQAFVKLKQCFSTLQYFRKPVVIEYYDHAIIRSITTHTEKSDQHWNLKIKVYLEVNPATKIWTGRVDLELTVDGPQKITIAKYERVPTSDKGTAEVDLNITISQVSTVLCSFIDYM